MPDNKAKEIQTFLSEMLQSQLLLQQETAVPSAAGDDWEGGSHRQSMSAIMANRDRY